MCKHVLAGHALFAYSVYAGFVVIVPGEISLNACHVVLVEAYDLTFINFLNVIEVLITLSIKLMLYQT